MFATALIRRMTGDDRFVSGDASERRSGYVALSDVLTIVNEQTDRFTDAINDLKETFHNDSSATRTLVETYRAETNRRLDALEAWRNEEQLDEAMRRGFWHVSLLAFRWLTEHWQVVWALVFLLTTIFWRLTGAPPVGIGPVQP